MIADSSIDLRGSKVVCRQGQPVVAADLNKASPSAMSLPNITG